LNGEAKCPVLQKLFLDPLEFTLTSLGVSQSATVLTLWAIRLAHEFFDALGIFCDRLALK
jgi:hypothetical protein